MDGGSIPPTSTTHQKSDIISYMSRKDRIKEEIGILKEDYKNFFIVFMTIITASFTAFYQVILGSVPIWVFAIGSLGFIIAVFVLILMKRKKVEIDTRLTELEGIE